MPGIGVANAAGLRNTSPPSLMYGSTPGTRSGRRLRRESPPPGVLITAVRPAAAMLEVVPGGVVAIDDVVAGDQHFDRQAAARVGDAADRPAALQRTLARDGVERRSR